MEKAELKAADLKTYYQCYNSLGLFKKKKNKKINFVWNYLQIPEVLKGC